MQCARTVCACVLVLFSCRVSTINMGACEFMYVSVGAQSERMEYLLDSKAGRLILHGLSKWGEEEEEGKSCYSHYRMHPAVVPSA